MSRMQSGVSVSIDCKMLRKSVVKEWMVLTFD